jgi:hypothetical protein
MSEVAAKLRELGVSGVLIQAAEQGQITELACQMEKCFCPEELGGRSYFEPVTDGLSDWMPTVEHSPIAKRDGGHRVVGNVLLAHRLCNRVGYSIEADRPYGKDIATVERAREEAIRRQGEEPQP